MPDEVTPDDLMRKAIAAMAADSVRRRANDTMEANAQRDHLKFARKLGPGESCGWCRMLASRGFVYGSARAAGEGQHWHRNCRCEVVPGFEGMEIEGGLLGGKTTNTSAVRAKEIEAIKGMLQGKGLDDKDIDGIAYAVSRIADQDVKDAVKRALTDVKFDSLTSKKAFYAHDTHGISIDMSKTAAGFSSRKDKGEYQTFFHEFGHYIDHRFNGYAMDTYDVKRGRTVYRYQVAKGLSEEMELDKAIKRDVQRILNGIKKSEGCTLYEAKEKLTEEIFDIYKNTPDLMGGISDIIHGATGGKCCDYGLPKHSNSYWKTKGALAHESFAHFVECAAANPDALETLKRYLPESYNVFKKILGGIT